MKLIPREDSEKKKRKEEKKNGMCDNRLVGSACGQVRHSYRSWSLLHQR